MTLVDWIIVVILAGAMLDGLARGFLHSVFSLGGLVLGLILAAWNYGLVAGLLMHVVRVEPVANTIAFLLIALVVMGLAGAMGTMLTKAVHMIGLGCLNRLAGAAFGLFQGALLVTLFILVTVAFFPHTNWLTESRLPRHFFGACHLSTHLSPAKLADLVQQELKTLEAEAPAWTHPGMGGM